MTLPEKYIRAAYKNALAPIGVYDGMAPTDALPPYIVITGIESIPAVSKCPGWVSTVTFTIFDEYQEYGNNVNLDDTAQDILDAAGHSSSTYLLIQNFGVVNIKLLASFNDIIEVGSVQIFRRVLRIQHTLNEN